MTRLFLAAGVAALAIAAPATAAGPGGHGGGQRADRAQKGERAQAAPRVQRVERQAQRVQRADRQAPRMQRAERQSPRMERMTMQSQRSERVRPNRVERAQAQSNRGERVQHNQRAQAQRVERVQQRADRSVRVQERMADRRQTQANRVNQRQQVQANRAIAVQNAQGNRGQGYGVGGCPPGLAGKNCTPPGIAAQQGLAALRANRVVAAQSPLALRSALAMQRLDARRSLAPLPLTLSSYSSPILPVGQAYSYLGQPLSALGGLGLVAMPSAVSYLYPTTPDYYYQYGNGYAYQVDRTSNLISALLPLIAGGYMPGQYLPTSYMSSYVPNYYGLNSFYPATYGSGYGYDNLCNRYANGVVYRVDCYTGMVVNVVPLYASGYGVGQMIPSSYDYYNVPYQYRSLYPASANMGYWYAPGAIYQYDPSSSLITSVAALLSPGMTIGQTMPAGYGAYNVPYAYRTQYVDTANDWYRYNNGYIYRVDPTTQLVSAIVASVLT